jgi:hypothetical protein
VNAISAALPVDALTESGFAPFGMVGMPCADGVHAAGDVALDLLVSANSRL